MPTPKDALKKVIQKLKRSQELRPPQVERIRRVQQTAKKEGAAARREEGKG